MGQSLKFINEDFFQIITGQITMTRVHKLVSLMYVLFKRMFQHLKIVSVLQYMLYMHRVSDRIPKVAFE